MTASTEVRQPSGRHLPEGGIRITAADRDRLEALVAGQSRQYGVRQDYLEALEREIDRALVVSSQEVPPDVVTMNSRVLVRNRGVAFVNLSATFRSTRWASRFAGSYWARR